MTRLIVGNINPRLVQAEYAVRGQLAIRSEAYKKQLREGRDDLPFTEIINANVGNPQQLDQKPITFFRQVLSLLENPRLLDHDEGLSSVFGYPSDVVERAKTLLSHVKSVGAYSTSTGVPQFKDSIAEFLFRRDGFAADPSHIYLSGGASSAVNTLLNTICAGESTGVLVPIPQYPLYTALLALLGARCVPYYLDESSSWGTSIEGIEQACKTAKETGIDVRAIVIINPGNPTGSSLSENDIQKVLEFADREELVILADEVYQANIFTGSFHSFCKVLLSQQSKLPVKLNVELASIHSTSKGMTGECGHRGGYFELIGFDPEVEAQIYKFVSITLCAPVIGQCLVEMMVNPPQPGSPSYELYAQEYQQIHETMRERALALYKAFQGMEGVECGEPQGSMYLFPTIRLPPRAIEEAKRHAMSPDGFYCSRMLDSTGICIVPGSGFGQAEGTFHFRITFLAPGTEWMTRMKRFHNEFMEDYNSGT